MKKIIILFAIIIFVAPGFFAQSTQDLNYAWECDGYGNCGYFWWNSLLPGGSKKPTKCENPTGTTLKAGMKGFFAFYCEVADPDYKEAKEVMRKEKVIEGIAAELNKTLNIPKPIVLTFQECKQSNAFYIQNPSTIVICYELVDTFYQKFEEEGYEGDELDEAVANAATFAFFHELGHALVDVLKLPVTGKEEDFVDQLATFIVADGTDEEETTAFDGATAFLLMAKDTDRKRKIAFWNQHSLGEERFNNIICSLYGDSPEKYESVVTEGLLTKQRASQCVAEWKKIESSWSRLLAPYIKQN